MIIANDPVRREFIHSAPESNVPLQYITTDLWPKLGFLPIDPENPGVALIAEFMLNELILKNSDSLESLNLQHLKELFSGEGEEDDEAYDMDMEDMDAAQLEQLQQMQMEMDGSPPEQPGKAHVIKEKKSEDEDADSKKYEDDNYSDESEDDRFLDINDLKRRREEREQKSPGKSKKKKAAGSDDGGGADQEDNYEDDFDNWAL